MQGCPDAFVDHVDVTAVHDETGHDVGVSVQCGVHQRCVQPLVLCVQ